MEALKTTLLQKRWMDGMLFEEWVRELDRKFLSEGRNVALVIDNCPAHPHIENLKAIKLFFLPPNTTSISQWIKVTRTVLWSIGCCTLSIWNFMFANFHQSMLLTFCDSSLDAMHTLHVASHSRISLQRFQGIYTIATTSTSEIWKSDF